MKAVESWLPETATTRVPSPAIRSPSAPTSAPLPVLPKSPTKKTGLSRA